MKVIPVVLLLIVQLAWSQCAGAAATATNSDYTCSPPYLAQSAKPNINLVLDYSGSMQFPAYITYNNGVYSAYDVTETYFGYFKASSYYQYGGNYWVENDASCSSINTTSNRLGSISSGCLSGNFLNYAITSRVNTLRKVLTGGRFDTTTNTYVDEGASPADSGFPTDAVTDSTTHCKITITNPTSTTRTIKLENVTANTSATLTGVAITVSATAKTFTIPRGSNFNGFVVGNVITTTGFTNAGNNGSFTITAITAASRNRLAKITCSAATGLVNETSRTTAVITNAVASSNTCVLLGTASSATTYKTHNQTTTPEDVTGVVQSLYPSQSDLELAIYNGTIDVVYRTGKNKNVGDYVTAINTEFPQGGTNTGPALADAQNYFKQINMTQSSSSTDSANNSLMISKTDATKDPYYNTGSQAAPCRKAFTLLISDGQWNTGVDPVVPAYYMHMNDLRTDTDLPGTQSVATFTVYAYGDGDQGRNAMINTAMWGGFSDKDGNNAPYPFAAVTATNKASGTYDPFGNSDSLNYPSATTTFPISECTPGGTWSALCTEWASEQSGLPYNFFEASDGGVLNSEIIRAVSLILGQANSGTAASIIGNNDNSGSVLLQALFYPEKQFISGSKIQWAGELQAYWYYIDPLLDKVSIREDSVNDYKLKLSEDKIAEFNFDGSQTKVWLYADANGDGSKDNPSTPDKIVDPDVVNSLFSAGFFLYSMDPSTRTIFTSDPSATSATKLNFQSDSTTVGKLYQYMDTDSTSAIDIIDFTRGVYNSSYRDRTIEPPPSPIDTSNPPKVWKLGDVINSTPKIQSKNRLNSYNLMQPGGFSDSSYDKFINSKDYRLRGTAYVGANDGMLHAFKVGSNFKGSEKGIVAELKNPDGSFASDLGRELWAFIPKHSLPYLQYLASPSYQHIFMVDATPLLIDASINQTTPTASDNTAITCTDSTYSQCVKKTSVSSSTGQLNYDTTAAGGGTSWRTVLLAGTGMGGAASSTFAATATGASISVASSKFHRATGSFITEGFAVGTVFTSSGFTNSGNNGIFTVTAVTATDITCSTSPTTAETATTSAKLQQLSVKTPISSITNATNGFGYSSIFALDVTNPVTSDLTSGTYPKLMWEFSDPRLGFTTVTPAVIRIKDANETSGGPQLNGKWYAIVASGPTGPIKNGWFMGYSDKKLTIFVLDLKTGALVRTFSSAATAGINTQFTLPVDAPAFAGSLSGATTDTDKFDGSRAGAYSDDAIYIGYTRGNSATAPTVWDKGGVVRLLTNNDPNPANWKISNLIDGIGPVTSTVTKLQDAAKSQLWLYFGTGRYYTKGDDPTNVQSLFGVKDPCFVTGNVFNATCTTSVAKTDLDNRTSTSTNAVTKGWYIDLPAGNGSTTYAKRVITDPAASTNGVVSFTTFTPSADICGYGGNTTLWALRYDTGASGAANMKGQILLQLSTGAYQQVDMSKAFTLSDNRETTTFKGVPPHIDPQVSGNSNHRPSKRFLHIQER